MEEPSEVKTQLSLFRLPDEILLKIIGHLDDWSEAEEIHDKKLEQTVTIPGFGGPIALRMYLHDAECPILTSFQTFAVVNHQIYSLCRPIIWQRLTFPSPLPGPMTTWMKEILPKHGSYVKTVYAELREEWFERPPKPLSIKQAIKHTDRRQHAPGSGIEEAKESDDDEDIYTDNFSVSLTHRRHQHEPTSLGLCPENLVRVLSYCEKLTTLELICPDTERNYPNSGEVRNLSYNLTSLFSELGNLQHLKLSGPYNSSIQAECIYKPLTQLPLLESLDLACVAVEDRRKLGSLATSLHSLKKLRCLVMDEVDALNSSWGCQEGPPHLDSLMITDCTHLRFAKTPVFVSSWAPHLTHLELRFVEPYDDLSQEDLSRFNPKRNRVSLPALTHLTIWPHSGCHYIHCFSDCKELRQLTFNYFIRCDEEDEEDKDEDFIPDPDGSYKGLIALSEFIAENVFPKLKVIVIPIEEDHFPLEPISAAALSPLEEFCKLNGIELKLFPGDIRRKTWRVRHNYD
ncbi:uncharacterized protein MELLADRAFT_94860 [Melampsora larici-populina 98AG31]|uniref:Disease resistance R13L4/SHOC-2-like LRR domain-containing protein n=1 Tax=Melampsora larici-populina (strain 98AG31 / pathotype 3-4-7) TaxID=747676 RepID=F4S869_MELLP|nr:uncharacterized protein MELLADRAFT_94860 [Melampsora larici-populina 98AG31]EGF99135.1 hypothetical protein MELLADRAFT_94860 [Melampsora larici-populina 98AG31]